MREVKRPALLIGASLLALSLVLLAVVRLWPG